MTETRFKQSIDSRQIADRLGQLRPGEHVTYEELSRLIGRDVRRFAISCLATAIRQHLREGVVFAALRGQGIKRLDDAELVGVGDRSLNHIRRHARKSAHKLASFRDFDALPKDDKARVLAMQSALGAVLMFSKPEAIRRLQSGVQKSMKELPIGKTLKLFVDEEEE